MTHQEYQSEKTNISIVITNEAFLILNSNCYRRLNNIAQLMYAIECGDYEGILSWNHGGLSFKIERQREFEETVLPEIFKDAKFASFRRKVRFLSGMFISLNCPVRISPVISDMMKMSHSFFHFS